MKTNSQIEAERRVAAALNHISRATADLMEACASLHAIAGMADEWERVNHHVDRVKNLWHDVRHLVPLQPDLDPDAKRAFDEKKETT